MPHWRQNFCVGLSAAEQLRHESGAEEGTATATGAGGGGAEEDAV